MLRTRIHGSPFPVLGLLRYLLGIVTVSGFKNQTFPYSLRIDKKHITAKQCSRHDQFVSKMKVQFTILQFVAMNKGNVPRSDPRCPTSSENPFSDTALNTSGVIIFCMA